VLKLPLNQEVETPHLILGKATFCFPWCCSSVHQSARAANEIAPSFTDKTNRRFATNFPEVNVN